MTYAMILCAGFGTRLNDLTKDTPKPMLQVGGKPMLEYTIRHLKKFGVEKILINLHYLPEQITSYFGNGENFGVEIIYSYEDAPLGTAGAIKNVEDTLKQADDFLVIYGDIFTNLNYADFINFHKSKDNALASIIVHERAKSNSIVEIDENKRVVKFIERPTEEQLKLKTQNWVNSAVYCFNKEILELIPEGFSDFPKDIFPKVLSAESLYALPLSGYRCAVDSAERYSMLQLDYENGKILF
jgi:NDP-sugar pyrophosphorylase family protein